MNAVPRPGGFTALRAYLRRAGDRQRAGLAAQRETLAAKPPSTAGPAGAPAASAAPPTPLLAAPELSVNRGPLPERERSASPAEPLGADRAAGLRPESLFAGADALARAVIAAEILAKPVALRER